ncbi:MAG: hypothetical protein PX483_08500 [Nostocales cyanobacterium LE14-WE4]|nr:hypothetical protein [Anabaena sp. 49633_E8]MCE2701697.1 hypothetical protein [Anabaena sp. 49633_E8]MDJ0500877.1 hypothetical protein [Nostocales cyanobacterium LE14-WE4]
MSIIVNLQKIALLTGLTVASVLGSGALSPAHAILTTYVISNGSLSDGGTLSGSFNYDPVTSSYSAFDLLVSASTQNSQQSAITYTSSNSILSASYNYISAGNLFPVPPSAGFELSLNTATLTGLGVLNRRISLNFAGPLTSVAGAITDINPGLVSNAPNFAPSGEFSNSNFISQQRGVLSGAFITAQPVPWETDALPLVGATMVFGAGVFVKRKIAQGKIKNLNFEPVKSE